MTLRLALVRHAKSDWGDPGLDDHDRPLNARGHRDAPVMAGRLAEAGFPAEAILSSTALRARTTAAEFGAALGLPVEEQSRLYGAPGRVVLEMVAERDVATVVVVAHDPGMSALAAHLSDGGIAHMPTCAVATFTWRGNDWTTVEAVTPVDWTFDSPR